MIYDFAHAAFPWIAIGLAIAFSCNHQAKISK